MLQPHEFIILWVNTGWVHMWRKGMSNHRSTHLENQTNDFKILLRYINHLARHKMGYPVSLLTYLGVIDNKILGIRPGSLANVLLNNVGDPFKDSETSLMEVKRHERDLISILEHYYGLEKGEARGYVTTGGTEGNFAGLWWSKRYLINIELPQLIEIDDAIKLQSKEEQSLMFELAKISTNDYVKRTAHLEKIINIKNTISNNKNIVQQLLTPTVFYSKGTTHYSIPKIAEILRLNIRAVEPNLDGSMNLESFKKELLLNLGAYPHSPIIVIANIGTTITGAIDDVPAIHKVLSTIKPALDFTIHLDGALTGFVMPILKPFGNVANYFDAIGANTLAVSAHKYPGLSQPCGIILTRKAFFEKAFEKSERSIDYVGNIIDVTITGSRSGLNVLMFYNALHTLDMHKGTEKLQKMVKENLENAKYLYDELVKIYGEDEVYYPYHFNVSFPKPSISLAKKYQLMLTGNKATICVLTNVTKSLINQFIQDLKTQKEGTMTANNMTQTDYAIHTLTEEYSDSVIELLTKCFCDSEPITKHLGIQYEDYKPFVKEVVQKAIKDGLSKVAVSKDKRVVVAACLAEDIADPFIPKLAHYPKLRPIFGLIDEVSKNFLKDKTFQKEKIIHVWLAAVDSEYRGIGLSTAIDMATIENAARKGYDFAYAEFTNEISEKVTHQFTVLQMCNRIKYDDFKQNSQYPFKGLPGSATAYVAAIRPGVKLNSLQNYYKIEEKY